MGAVRVEKKAQIVILMYYAILFKRRVTFYYSLESDWSGCGAYYKSYYLLRYI